MKKKAVTANKRTVLFFAGAVILVFAYLAFKFLSLSSYTESSTVQLDRKGMSGRKGNFYVYEDPDSEKFDFDQATDQEVPKILNTPLTMVWKPKQFPLTKRIELTADIDSAYDLEFKVNCKPCSRDTDTPTTSFFLNALYDYPYVSEFDDGYLYSMTEVKDAQGSIEEWLSSSLDAQKDIEVLNNSLDLKEIENSEVDYQEDSYTSIQTDLTGSHELYLYLDRSLELQLRFRNRDYTNIDPDQIRVTLTDLEGTQIALRPASTTAVSTIPTDSITQVYEAKTLPHRGSYKLSISVPENMIIKSIEANTNKIVLNNYVSLSRNVELYTEASNERTFFARSTTYNGISDIQLISLDRQPAEKTTMDLNRNNLVDQRAVSITPGTYRIESSGAIEFRGMLFSFSEEQFFNPFDFELSSQFTSDYVVSNFMQEKTGADTSRVTYIVDTRDLSLLESLQRVEFQILSRKLDAKFSTETSILEKYFASSVIPPYTTYVRAYEEDVLGATEPVSISAGGLLELIPVGSSVLFTTQTPFPQDLFILQRSTELIDESETKLDLHLLGDHQFYLITPDRLNLRLSIDPYLSDQLFQLQLRNSNGKVLCTQNYSSSSSDRFDLEFECDTEAQNIYTLTVRTQRQEFLNMKGAFEIVDMTINTDKVMIKEKARILTQTELYSSSPIEKRVEISALTKTPRLLVTVADERNVMVEDAAGRDGSEMVVKNMPKGSKRFDVSVKGVIISGVNLAVNEENIFDPYSHYLVIDVNANPDYIIADMDQSDGIYISKISIDVQ